MNSSESHLCNPFEDSVTIPRWFYESLLWHIDSLHDRISPMLLDVDINE